MCSHVRRQTKTYFNPPRVPSKHGHVICTSAIIEKTLREGANLTMRLNASSRTSMSRDRPTGFREPRSFRSEAYFEPQRTGRMSV